MPSDVFNSAEQALAFDMNVMLAGMAAEIRAQDEAQRKGSKLSMTSNRHDAFALARRARQVADAEFGT